MRSVSDGAKNRALQCTTQPLLDAALPHVRSHQRSLTPSCRQKHRQPLRHLYHHEIHAITSSSLFYRSLRDAQEITTKAEWEETRSRPSVYRSSADPCFVGSGRREKEQLGGIESSAKGRLGKGYRGVKFVSVTPRERTARTHFD